MLWTVGARFSFSEAELWALPLSRLVFWYRGALQMHADEQAAVVAAVNGSR
jgi:hypothetical protein